MSNKILYTSGDSNSWGSELKDRSNRYSKLLADKKGLIDFNVASSGISNDRIYRNAMRDLCKFVNKKPIFNEEFGYLNVDEIFVLISFTAPTRFDYFDGDVFINEQLWTNDRWGLIDSDKVTDNKYVINQTNLIPSFIRIFQQIISLKSFCEINKIPHLFVNTFFDYSDEEINKLNKNINVEKVLNQFDDTEDYFGLIDLWKQVPQTFKDINLLNYLKKTGEDGMFEERRHPSPKGHKIIAEMLNNII
jgi:hypothetical protein